MVRIVQIVGISKEKNPTGTQLVKNCDEEIRKRFLSKLNWYLCGAELSDGNVIRLVSQQPIVPGQLMKIKLFRRKLRERDSMKTYVEVICEQSR